MKQYRIQDYKEARAFIDNYMKHKRDFVIIHYACQGFYDAPNESYPHIAAICVLFPQTGHKELFSLVSLAELQNIDLHTADQAILDQLEAEMLKSFYEFAKKQKQELKWLHWNMKDHFYGFAAIAQRYCKLNKKKKVPFEFVNDKQQNIALLLKQRYGENYAPHPHQQHIFRLNQMNPKNYLTGAEEAEAYKKREFLAIERSLEDKVAAFAEILDKMGNNELKTNSRLLRDVYGLSLAGLYTYAKEHIILSTILSVLYTVILELLMKFIFG